MKKFTYISKLRLLVILKRLKALIGSRRTDSIAKLQNDIFKISYIIILSISSFFVFTQSVIAATPTEKPKSVAPLNQQINQLKDRIASRVAELKLVERRGVIGKVTDVSDTQITLSDSQNNIRFIDVDELTKFSSPSAKGSFGISDITKGSTLGILGLFNKQSERVLARFVDVVQVPAIFHGTVASVDTKDYTVTIALPDNKQITIDIETTTKTLVSTKENGITRSGFSKIKEGQRITVYGLPKGKEKDRFSGVRMLIFPELAANPQIKVAVKAQPTETVTPTDKPTESVKKVTPTKK